MTESNNPDSIQRRDLLKAFGAASMAGVAGCQGGLGGGGGGGNGSQSNGSGNGSNESGGGSNQLGERVPTVVMEYWSDYGAYTTIQENMAPRIKQNAQQALGVNYRVKPVQFSTQLSNISNDQRTHDVTFFWYVNGLYRLDPQELTIWFGANRAGSNGLLNPANWANCNYTTTAINQQFAPTQEKRRQMIYKSQQQISEASIPIPLTPNVQIGAYRSEAVNELKGVDKMGMTRINPNVFIKTTTDRDQLVAGTDPIQVQTKNFPTITSGLAVSVWSTLIHSPLLMYDSSFEIQPYLAKNYEVTNGGQRITFELREGAQFHNGDPITAEDVQFTFEQLVRGAEAGAYPKPSLPPYESIKQIDEKTVEFNFTEPYTLFTTAIAPRWGILHKDTWVEGGAVEDPGNFTFDPPIGSGPFKVTNYGQNRFLDTAPFEDHPVDVPDHGIYWRAFRDEQSTFQALREGELQLQPEISPGIADRAARTEGLQEVSRQGFLPFVLYPQFPLAPSKFEAFRKALAASINRSRLSEVAYRGRAEETTYANHFLKNHPWRAPEDMLYKMADPGGSPGKAERILQDAGWGWDDGGNLRYPADADLKPVWPKGREVPPPEEFACLEELNLLPESAPGSGGGNTSSNSSNASSNATNASSNSSS